MNKFRMQRFPYEIIGTICCDNAMYLMRENSRIKNITVSLDRIDEGYLLFIYCLKEKVSAFTSLIDRSYRNVRIVLSSLAQFINRSNPTILTKKCVCPL